MTNVGFGEMLKFAVMATASTEDDFVYVDAVRMNVDAADIESPEQYSSTKQPRQLLRQRGVP